VHTVGGVVTPAEPLMLIVPEGGDLEVEAWLRNEDIGFVHRGQTAAVKVKAFPFTRYGTVEGEVADLSSDAVAKEGLGLVYAMRVVIGHPAIPVGAQTAGLSPGMAVTVEVKTGRRRLIEFVLSPLLRGLHESARER